MTRYGNSYSYTSSGHAGFSPVRWLGRLLCLFFRGCFLLWAFVLLVLTIEAIPDMDFSSWGAWMDSLSKERDLVTAIPVSLIVFIFYREVEKKIRNKYEQEGLLGVILSLLFIVVYSVFACIGLLFSALCSTSSRKRDESSDYYDETGYKHENGWTYF